MLGPAAEAKLNIGSRMRELGAVTALHACFRRRRQVGVRKIMKSTGRTPKCRRAWCNLVGGSTQPNPREFIVLLIAYYMAFMIAGDLAAYAIGRITEFEFGGQVSLIVFLALYFLFLWVAWVLAVWMTKPRHDEPESSELA
jgi:hypothetical protein